MSSHGSSRRTAYLRYLDLEDRLAPSRGGFDPDHLLVSFAEVVPESVRLASLESATSDASVEALGLGLYRVSIPSAVDRANTEGRLRKLSGVKTVGPDYVVLPDAVSNDPVYGQNASAGNSIGLPAAWTTTTGTGQTIVAVIDSGIDVTHPDLAPNLWTNSREIAGNNRDDDGNGFIDDLHGVDFTNNSNNLNDALQHGTHVAGIIGAVGGNGIGVAGVDWRTRIMPLKFIGANGGLTSNAVRALDYALRNGAKIINASWGGSPYDASFAEALSRARNTGAIVVASAGNYASNNDQSPFYPAAYTTSFDNVVSVAAVNDAGTLASWSNFGAASVTLAAPGVNITSTLPNGRYGALSGTSMAAPFVSGALALLWDQNPTWNYKQIVDKLKSSTDVLPTLAGKVSTGGRLNVAKLVANLPVNPPVAPVVPPPPSTDRTGPSVVSAAFGSAKVGQFDRVVLTFNEAVNPATLTNASITISGPAGAINISAVVPVAGSNNTRFTLLFSRAQSNPGNYSIVVNAGVRDAAGVALDQNADGVPGQATDVFRQTAALAGSLSPPTVPIPPPAPPTVPPVAARASYTPGAMPKTIAPRRTTRVEIAVTDSFTVNDTTVSLNLVHPRSADLSIRLTSPDGRRVTLVNRNAFAATASATTTFGDTFGTKPLQSLGVFQGVSARGIWILELFDLGDGTAGTLNSAVLSFARPSIAVPSTWSAGVLYALNTTDLDAIPEVSRRAILEGRGDVIAKVR